QYVGRIPDGQMTRAAVTSWIELRPPLATKASREAFSAHARSLARVHKDDEYEDAVDEVRGSFIESLKSSARLDSQVLLAAGLVVADLAMQGWQLRVRRGRVEVRSPRQVSDDRATEKARIRRQELVKRDAQLRQDAVQRFLRSMERTRVFKGKFTSIFSL